MLLNNCRLQRLNRKTPPHQVTVYSSQTESSSLPARGFYDCLRIGRAAALPVIRRAYRLRALVTHPDKGGDAAAFEQVFTAFETLADTTKRATYDLELDTASALESNDRQDGYGWSNEVPGMRVSHTSSQAAHAPSSVCSKYSAALRKSFAAINKFATSEADILQFSAYELLILQGLLRKDKPPWLQNPTAGATLEFQKGTTKFRNLSYHKESGTYWVNVTICNFRIESQETHSLEQAIDWQIALICMRTKALIRIRSGDAECVDPLLEEELFDALCDQPSMRLVFVTRGIFKRYLHPRTSSLSLAILLRRSLRSACISWEEAAQQVKEYKKDFVDHCSKLLAMVDTRLPSQVHLLSTASDHMRANEANARIAASLQVALKLDPESARKAIFKLNALPPDELDRRVGWLLAPAPCLAIPSAGVNGKPFALHDHPSNSKSGEMLAPMNPTSGGNQKRKVKRKQSTSSKHGPNKYHRLRPREPPVFLHEKLDQQQFRWSASAFGSIMGLAFETFCHILGWLTVRELDCINEVSIAMKSGRCTEIWQRLRVFTFQEHDICPPKFSSFGRIIREAAFEVRLTSCLVGFLTKYAQVFEILHLHTVPCAVLESPRIQKVMSKLPHMARITLPNSGWSDATSRKKLLRSLLLGVRFEFVDAHGATKSHGVA